MKWFGYLKTRVQFDDARQRERGKQRTGRDRALQNPHRWRSERAPTSVAPRAVWGHAKPARWYPSYARARRSCVRTRSSLSQTRGADLLQRAYCGGDSVRRIVRATSQLARSEERRVGKESRDRWGGYACIEKYVRDKLSIE